MGVTSGAWLALSDPSRVPTLLLRQPQHQSNSARVCRVSCRWGQPQPVPSQPLTLTQQSSTLRESNGTALPGYGARGSRALNPRASNLPTKNSSCSLPQCHLSPGSLNALGTPLLPQLPPPPPPPPRGKRSPSKGPIPLGSLGAALGRQVPAPSPGVEQPGQVLEDTVFIGYL